MCKAIIYGKPGCGICEAAQRKLVLLGIPNEKLEISGFLELHNGWRTDGSVEISSAYFVLDQRLPVIKINGEYHDYPNAMREAKKTAKKPRKDTKHDF